MNLMNIHYITYIQLVMLYIIISSIEINVKELNNVNNVINYHHDHNDLHSDPDPDQNHDPDPDPDHNNNDIMNNGINDIMNILETVNNLSIQEYTSMNDDISNKEDHLKLLRYPRSISLTSTKELNNEYEDIPCYFQCILRSYQNNEEIKKISKIVLHISKEKITILDCFNSSSSLKTVTTTMTTTLTTVTTTMTTMSSTMMMSSIPMNNLWNQSIISQCVIHFTKRLLHIIIGKLSYNFNIDWFIITSNQFISSIYYSIESYIQSTTDLYITLTIPIYRLDRQDFNRLSKWLKYLSINGKQLRYIDVMLIANLTLDYFILQDCIRNDEIIINPLVTTLPDSRIELYNHNYKNCLVYWIYTCPNYSQFILIADKKTHQYYCNTINSMKQSKLHLVTKQSIIKNLRAKRSLKHSYERKSTTSLASTPPSSPPPPPRPASLSPPPVSSSSSSSSSSSPPTPLPTISSLTTSSIETLINNQIQSIQSKIHNHSNILTVKNQTMKDCTFIENDIKQFINDKCEQKITWLTNMLTILLIILLVMIIILLSLLLGFSYFIKQYLLLKHESKIR
ncbi:unnamed protein product [Schistosoma spindalis]|nr:unnamed protein product [Schistosoma spindale]